jgi:alpha-tubulin suppressor-like RCC1 family protein
MESLAAVNLGVNQTVSQVSVGAAHNCVLLVSTNIKCFGHANNGKLGDGSGIRWGSDISTLGDAIPIVDLEDAVSTPTASPTESDTPTATASLTATASSTVTKTPSKTYTRSKTPTRTKTKTKTRTPTKSKTPKLTPVGYVSRVQLIASGVRHSCALLANTTVKCWGYNASGELGIGDTTTRGDTVGEMGNGLATVNLGTGVYVKKMYAGGSHTCVLTTTNQIKCWGNNVYGQLGLGDNISRSTPTEIATMKDFLITDIYNSKGIK